MLATSTILTHIMLMLRLKLLAQSLFGTQLSSATRRISPSCPAYTAAAMILSALFTPAELVQSLNSPTIYGAGELGLWWTRDTRVLAFSLQ